jgi:hypothetical protein
MANILGKIKWALSALAVAALVVLAPNSLPFLRAASLQSAPTVQLKTDPQAGMIDRSRKGDRLVPMPLAIKIVPPPGCEFPFSPLAKLSPPHELARCLT